MLVDAITPAVYQKNAFDRLVLDPKRKRIIQALVASHAGESTGIVAGKGAGLVFLLGGPPGVGKTLTAEAIAETQERPLYTVGAGELGTQPGAVEAKLKEIFDMAVIWNAIVLLDEADIFMEARTKDDIHRNAIVAIFLRMIEYFDGILFLTTNRVDDLDDAFLSRISMRLLYLELDRHQRLQIWKDLCTGYAFDFNALAAHELNGREIQHCWQCTLTMARFENRMPTQEDINDMIAIVQDFHPGK